MMESRPFDYEVLENLSVMEVSDLESVSLLLSDMAMKVVLDPKVSSSVLSR